MAPYRRVMGMDDSTRSRFEDQVSALLAGAAQRLTEPTRPDDIDEIRARLAAMSEGALSRTVSGRP